MNGCNQADGFRAVLRMKMCARVHAVTMLATSGAHDDAADVSGDGQVTSLDALMILQAAAGNIDL